MWLPAAICRHGRMHRDLQGKMKQISFELNYKCVELQMCRHTPTTSPRHTPATSLRQYPEDCAAFAAQSLSGVTYRMNFPSQNAGLQAPNRIAVIVATKGRPQAIAELLALLEKQSCAPAVIVISATEPSDIGVTPATELNIEYLFGPAGLTAQRNRGLERVRTRADVAIFFDDDFAPAENWIEQCTRLFASAADIAGANGTVIRDGVKTQPVSWQQAREILALPWPTDPRNLSERADLYGCNMAFRISAINGLQFDERLVLYGWLEDKEFSRKAAKNGRLVESSLLAGVHLGLQSGRVSGKRYGYSQIVNAWYLFKKDALSLREASVNIMKALAANAAKTFRPENHIDRRGRLHGNLVGVMHLLSGACRPEKAAEL
jgi:glycosyltransferase involved in cell wall biosynthesis